VIAKALRVGAATTGRSSGQMRSASSLDERDAFALHFPDAEGSAYVTASNFDRNIEYAYNVHV
jgi:hypothetical protein